jgi:hypothetical protein
MAIMRCEAHHPNGRKRRYVASVHPVGYPDTARFSELQAPAFIWLEAHEKASYDRGERVFQSFTATMKVRAK